MPELRLSPHEESIEKGPAVDRKPASEPERELNSFVNSMAKLVGPAAYGSLADLWLDELACMECIPDSGSFNWRSVSVSASVKLASRVVASQLSGLRF
jgi:hypothetical protein